MHATHSSCPDAAVAGVRVIPFATLVDVARAWIQCVSSDGSTAMSGTSGAAGVEETCLLNNVQTAVTRLVDATSGGGGGGVVRVELINSRGVPFEVSRLSSDSRRPVRCLTGNASRMSRAAAPRPSDDHAASSIAAQALFTCVDVASPSCPALLSRVRSAASAQIPGGGGGGEDSFGSVLTAAGTLGDVTASWTSKGCGFMSSARAIAAPLRFDAAGSGDDNALACAVWGEAALDQETSVSLFSSDGCAVSSLAGVTHQSAGSIRIIEHEIAHSAASTTTEASLDATASEASKLPQMYQLQWTPIDEKASASSSTAIHWKKFDGYDAGGRAVLKEVYSQAMGGAVVGFEVNIEAVLDRAKQKQREVASTHETAWEKDEDDLEENPSVVAAATSELLAVLREAAADAAAAASSPASAPCPMYIFVSRGATRRPAVAALVALARGLQLEHPRVYGGVVDLDAKRHLQNSDEVESRGSVGDEQGLPAWRPATVHDVAYSVSVDVEGRCFAARLAPASKALVRACAAAAVENIDGAENQDGNRRSSSLGPSCCVTGGTGSLGLAFARAAAASREVEALTLISRSGRLDASAKREIESHGCRVDVVAADVRDANDMIRAMDASSASSASTVPSLVNNASGDRRGGSIIWAAGVTGHAPLAKMSDEECWEVLAPKVAASCVNRYTGTKTERDDVTKNVVLISSVSSVWGHSGAAHYAAANAYLDALAVSRSESGRATVSVRFGPFAGTGMISAEDERHLERVGVGALRAECALNVIRGVIGAAASGVIAANLNRKVFSRVHAAALGGREWDLLEGLDRVEEETKEEDTDAEDSRREGLNGPLVECSSEAAAAAAAAHRAEIHVPAALTVAEAADVLSRGLTRILGEAPAPEEPLVDAGLDSLTAVELADWLSTHIGLELPQTMVGGRLGGEGGSC